MLAIRLLVIYECYLFSSCVLSTCNTDMIKCNAGNLLYKQHTWTLACVIRRYFKCFQKKTSSATNQIQQRLIETTFLGSFFFCSHFSTCARDFSMCACRVSVRSLICPPVIPEAGGSPSNLRHSVDIQKIK